MDSFFMWDFTDFNYQDYDTLYFLLLITLQSSLFYFILQACSWLFLPLARVQGIGATSRWPVLNLAREMVAMLSLQLACYIRLIY